ncbi:MAG: energy transducer TonB [Bacteroidales bacterium]|nr:energy transducer TonB [Bacteroidales bacterium]
MKNLTWQNPEQLFVAQELINKVKSKCCGIKVKDKQEYLVYPEDAKKDSIKGYVFVRFVVDKEGHITNPEILKIHDDVVIDSPAFDSAALDVLSHLKTFIPGEQHGKKVNVYYTLPIMFRLDK